METSKDIYKEIDAILSLPDWEMYQGLIEELILKLDEIERSPKNCSKDARRCNR
jgi:hypothetical protein